MKAENRGYLADPKLVADDRLVLAQKYGYELPNIEQEEDEKVKNLMMAAKDPRQVFYGLQPGWVVSLKEKVIYKPVESQEIEDYYTK